MWPSETAAPRSLAVDNPDNTRRRALCADIDAAANVAHGAGFTSTSHRSVVNARADGLIPLLPQCTPAATQATRWPQLRRCFLSVARCACFGEKRPDGPPDGMLSCVPDAERARLCSRKWIGCEKVRGGAQAWDTLKQEKLKQLALSIRARCADASADLSADFDLGQGSVSEQLYRMIEKADELCCPSSYVNLIPGFYASSDPGTYVKAQSIATAVLQLESALETLLHRIVSRPTGGIAPPDWNHFALLPDSEQPDVKAWPVDVRAERMRLSAPVLFRLQQFERDVAAAAGLGTLSGCAVPGAACIART